MPRDFQESRGLKNRIIQEDDRLLLNETWKQEIGRTRYLLYMGVWPFLGLRLSGFNIPVKLNGVSSRKLL